MASIYPSFKALLFAISFLAPSTIAQNVTNSTDSCSSPNEAPTPINGTASAKLSDDLYVSLTFGDLRFREPALRNTFQPWTHGYISAPNDTTAQACVYMFTATEVEEGADNNGCSGVLSQSCISYLQQEMQIPTGSGKGVQCPSAPSVTSQGFNDACNTSAKGFSNSAIYTSSAMDLSNATCTEPPSKYSLDISSDYHTSQLFGFGPNKYDTNVSDYTWYDLYMKRAVPFVVSVIKDGQEVEAPQVVCLSPHDVVNGSRKPADDVGVGEGTPGSEGGGSGSGSGGNGQSAGVSVDWRAKGLMAMGMAAVTGLSLMLG